METDRFITITICMAIAVVILTTVAVPVMTLHESSQDVFENNDGELIDHYAYVSSASSVHIQTSDSLGRDKFMFNGVLTDLTDIVEPEYGYAVPLLVCDAGYVEIKYNTSSGSGYIEWNIYAYSEDVESGSSITNHVFHITEYQLGYPDSQFELDILLENNTLTITGKDSPGVIIYNVSAPVRLNSWVYDEDGDMLARTAHWLHPLYWSDYMFFVGSTGIAYNGEGVVWNPDAENVNVSISTTDLGGGAKLYDRSLSYTYTLNGETVTKEYIGNAYFVVPPTVYGAKTQGVDDPSIIVMVAIIPLIIALSLIIYLGRNIFSKE